jgi:peptidoglycan hydrolase-like protein with peptidoglycan-binding domain
VRPIRKGDRGPAVEDVQRRLLALGEDLGTTGVDGVFLGATYAAVRDFQQRHRLDEDGVVGPETWSALVDATFRLGDRLLYLRLPHLHGADVGTLQGALNALGFACGEPDCIFGAFTERAVREFQANTGLPVDGIAGPDTVRALTNLRHVWIDKDPAAPGSLRVAPARSTDCLAEVPVGVFGLDEIGASMADRVANLAAAADPRSKVAAGVEGTGLRLEIGTTPPPGSPQPPTVWAGEGGEALARRLAAALASDRALPAIVRVVLDGHLANDHDLQRVAVGLVDGLCIGLAASSRTVVG